MRWEKKSKIFRLTQRGRDLCEVCQNKTEGRTKDYSNHTLCQLCIYQIQYEISARMNKSEIMDMSFEHQKKIVDNWIDQRNEG